MTHALEFHASLLTAQEKEKWEARLNRTAEWVFQTITPQFDVNINYHAACAEAMALTGMYFHREKYLKRSDEMADFCMQYISKEGLFSERESRGTMCRLRAADLWILDIM